MFVVAGEWRNGLASPFVRLLGEPVSVGFIATVSVGH